MNWRSLRLIGVVGFAIWTNLVAVEMYDNPLIVAANGTMALVLTALLAAVLTTEWRRDEG